MDPSTIVTRQAEIAAATERPQTPQSLLASDEGHYEVKRNSDAAALLDTLLSIAEKLSSGIDPTNENITMQEFRYLQQINTALFALNIVNSGLPLTSMCQYLQDPSIASNLQDNYINPKQAANIVCFASVYGLYLGQSNDQILADLAALEYAVQMHAYNTASLQEVCQSLNYGAAQLLGIDAEDIQKNVCNGTAGASKTSILPSASTATDTAANISLISFTLPFPTATFGTAWTGEGTGTSWSSVLPTTLPGSLSQMAVSGTGFWNSTAPSTTASMEMTTQTQSSWIINTGSSIIFGTGGSRFSSAISAAGTVAPWFNVTTTDSTPTSGSDSVVSSGRTTPSEGFTQGASFYVPPKLVRDRLRRHG